MHHGFLSPALWASASAVSGYFAGAVGFLIQKFVKVIWAFPALLLAIAIMAYLSQGLGTLILALVMQHRVSYIAVSREVKHCRCANVNSSRRRALGASDARIIVWHIVPVCFSRPSSSAPLHSLSYYIGSGANFLGLGVPPEIPNWGACLQTGAPISVHRGG